MLCPPSFRFDGSSIPSGINCIEDKHVFHFVVHVYISHFMLILSVPRFAFEQLQSVTLISPVITKDVAVKLKSVPPGTSERKKQIGQRQGKHQRGIS